MNGRRIERRNVRRIYMEAMIAGDEPTLERVYAYLVAHGWAGGISALDAAGLIGSPSGKERGE